DQLFPRNVGQAEFGKQTRISRNPASTAHCKCMPRRLFMSKCLPVINFLDVRRQVEDHIKK
ncbi:unnamed protein product, partial [Dicrocoelium dendriticum]